MCLCVSVCVWRIKIHNCFPLYDILFENLNVMNFKGVFVYSGQGLNSAFLAKLNVFYLRRGTLMTFVYVQFEVFFTSTEVLKYVSF